MCGIGAVVNRSHSRNHAVVRRLVLSLIDELSVRGDDAAGIAAFRDGRVFVAKADSPASLIEKLEGIEGWEKADVILIHDRAATTCFDSYWCHHPLIDVIDGRIAALVHNGVVSYTAEPVPSRYDVDTDILLGFYRKYGFTRRAVEAMFESVEGWMAVIATDGHKLHAFRDRAPLVYTETNGMLVFASTEDILWRAVSRAGLRVRSVKEVEPGELMEISVK